MSVDYGDGTFCVTLFDWGSDKLSRRLIQTDSKKVKIGVSKIRTHAACRRRSANRHSADCASQSRIGVSIDLYKNCQTMLCMNVYVRR